MRRTTRASITTFWLGRPVSKSDSISDRESELFCILSPSRSLTSPFFFSHSASARYRHDASEPRSSDHPSTLRQSLPTSFATSNGPPDIMSSTSCHDPLPRFYSAFFLLRVVLWSCHEASQPGMYMHQSQADLVFLSSASGPIFANWSRLHLDHDKVRHHVLCFTANNHRLLCNTSSSATSIKSALALPVLSRATRLSWPCRLDLLCRDNKQSISRLC